MQFIKLMTPKWYETAALGTMPGAEAIKAMMKCNKSLQQADVLLALDRLHPPSMMGACIMSNIQRTPSL